MAEGSALNCAPSCAPVGAQAQAEGAKASKKMDGNRNSIDIEKDKICNNE